MYARTNSQTRLGRIWSVGASLALAGLVAGCSVAAGSPSAASDRPSVPGTSPVASSSPTAGPSASTPASIAPAPSGAWAGINWVDEGKAFPQGPLPASPSGTWSDNVSVFGWSGGYVGFRTTRDMNSAQTSQDSSTISTTSPDGVHWASVRPMDLNGLAWPVAVSQVIEGPSGLLAVGRNPASMCGGPISVGVLWTSTDGQTWTRVTPPADFASAHVFTVDGGSIGFIATGTLKDEVTQAIWISADGRNWTRGAVPTVTTGTFSINGATAFASGFVTAGATIGDGGCGGPGPTPSLWWSASGTSWARVKLPGVTPANDATVTVTRIDDQTVMAVAMQSSQSGADALVVWTETVWVTSNGKDWTLVKNPSQLLQFHVISNGQRTFVIPPSPDDKSAPPIQMVGDDAAITTLAQTGAVPGIPDPNVGTQWTYAIGPTGILCVATDGSGLWLGIPSS